MSPVRAHYTNLWPIWDNYSGVEGELWKLKGGSFLKSCSATLTFFLEPIWNDWACQSEWKDEWIGEVWEWMKMTRGASSSACSGWQLAGQLERLRLPPMFHQQATTSTRAPEQAVHQSTRAAGQQGSRACQQETWLGWTIELLHTSSWTLDTGHWTADTDMLKERGSDNHRTNSGSRVQNKCDQAPQASWISTTDHLTLKSGARSVLCK